LDDTFPFHTAFDFHYDFNNVFGTFAKTTLLYIACLLVLCCDGLNAQDSPPRFEIGGVLSAGKQTTLDVGQGGEHFHVGGGGRFTVNATVRGW